VAKNSVHRLVDNSQAMGLTIARQFGIANAAGSAGATVSTAVSFVDRYGTGLLPAGGLYVVQVMPSQACYISVNSKTSSGFNVVLIPSAPGGVNASIAAGTFDVTVIA
jgi:hypothetical protein